jgi:catechol 2,3-dioxygenase-like lactoylglutathione lyase family enzyme
MSFRAAARFMVDTRASAGPTAKETIMEYRLELVLLPVTDVDRAKAFYTEQAGFDLLVDTPVGEKMRVVQLTPPGSGCSIGFGEGLGVAAAPGTIKGLHLIVSDIVAARDELTGRGVEVSGIRHIVDGVWHDGPHPDRSDYNSFADFSDPDGNGWVLQEVKTDWRAAAANQGK